MHDDDIAETTGELDVTIAAVAGVALDALHVAVTISPRGGDVEEVATLIASLAHVEPVRWEARASLDEWIVGLAVTSTGTPCAVTTDGALRVGLGPDSRRYPLPARRGLAGLWLAADDDVLVCGPGVLGRVRLGRGRVIIDVTEDEAPGDACAVAGRDSARGAIAVGTHGAVWSYDGAEWIAHETAARETLSDVAWHVDGRAYVAGAEGGLFAWDGVALVEVARAEVALSSVTSWRGHVYVVSGRAAIARLDGDRLVPIKALPVSRVRAIDDHLVVWGGSLVARHDGTGWWGGPLHLP